MLPRSSCRHVSSVKGHAKMKESMLLTAILNTALQVNMGNQPLDQWFLQFSLYED